MSDREVLELALEGAKDKLAYAADVYASTRTSGEIHIEKIRTALSEYDKIKELIKECEEKI